jgi:hypothetical protein
VLAGVAVVGSSCGPPTVTSLVPRGRLKVEVQIPLPVPYAVTELAWSGNWVPDSGPAGLGDATTANGLLDLTPAAIAQGPGLVQFPELGLVQFPELTLRIGKWKISVTVTGDATRILSTGCTQEIFVDKTSTPKFIVGLQGCVCDIGCSNP